MPGLRHFEANVPRLRRPRALQGAAYARVPFGWADAATDSVGGGVGWTSVGKVSELDINNLTRQRRRIVIRCGASHRDKSRMGTVTLKMSISHLINLVKKIL